MLDKPIKVMLIEDNPGDARLIREMLKETEEFEFEVLCLDRLSRGLEHLARESQDIVLLDLGLPDSTGLETFNKLYQQKRELPVIVLTGLDDKTVAVNAVREGAQDYVVKGDIIGKLLVRSIRYAIERKRAEEKIIRLNRIYAVLSNINGAIVRIRDQQLLFEEACKIAVNFGLYRLAWIGLIDPKTHRVNPITYYGCAVGYLDQFKISFDDVPEGQCPTGASIRQEKYVICNDVEHDKSVVLWRKVLLEQGYRSIAAFPLKNGPTIIGTLTLIAAEPYFFDEQEIPLLQEIAADISFAINTIESEKNRKLAEETLQKSEKKIKESYIKLRRTLEETVNSLASALETRDPYTAGHERRDAQLVCAIAKEMGLSEDQIEGLRIASLLHDIGKMAVPAEILSKPTKLTDIEFKLIKVHPEVGYNILKDIDFPWPVAQIVYQHQERLDGSGYPQGLKGEEILLEARILTVADVVEAMSSHRPYRPALGILPALDEIRKHRGILYDPQAVDACLTLFQEKGFKFQ
ncbi:MAG: HD domain-containing phosphohydrolase [bacterium]